jgi:hypothetical protein
MELDLRSPTFVVTGTLNPAILQPGWIARYMLEVPEGQQVDALMPLTGGRVPPPIYFGGFGVAVRADRVDFFTNALDDKSVARCEAACHRFVEILRHTPFGALGVNFRFVEKDPDQAILDQLQTKDAVNQHLKIKRQRFVTVGEIATDIDLNFSREPTATQVVFDFNYHHRSITPDNARTLVEGAVKRFLERSTALLKSVYGLDGYVPVAQDVPRIQNS